MAIFTVSNLNDSGAGSLRDAIDQANATVGVEDTVEFAGFLAGHAIRLASTLTVSDALKIDGDIDNDGAADIVITGDTNNDDRTIADTSISDGFRNSFLDNVQILTSTADLTLEGLILTGGSARGTSARGGAVSGIDITIINSVITGNAAITFGGDESTPPEGGGVYAQGHATVIGSTISNNYAGGLIDIDAGRGGGLFAESVEMSNSTVSGNSTATGGGVFAVELSTLTNVTLSGNGAYLGDGGGANLGQARLYNVTVTGNLAVGTGGGLHDRDSVDINNSIVTANRSTSGAIDDVSDNINPVNSLIGSSYYTSISSWTSVNANVGELFAATALYDNGITTGVLGDNGGLVKTIALRAWSSNPALDAANGVAPDEDARGKPRLDQDRVANAAGAAADLGAYELQNANPTVTINLAPGQADPTATEPIRFNVKFSAGVTGFDASDVVFADSAVTGNPVAEVIGTDAFYTVIVTGAGTGKLVVNVAQGAAAAESGFWSNASTSSDNVVIIGEAPVLAALPAVIDIAENGTAVATVSATDADSPTVIYSLAGPDAARFVIDAHSGALAFFAAPNFEAPTDADLDNLYEIVVEVSDGFQSDSQMLSVRVTNVSEPASAAAPVLVALPDVVDVAENTKAVMIASATDADSASIMYSLSGEDAARFRINATTGVVQFLKAPDFEAPADADQDNLYQIEVWASDGTLIDVETLAVRVADLSGVAIRGTAQADVIGAGHTVGGQAGPTLEDDTILGRGGNDRLWGLRGDDLLDGGAGKDKLTGDGGADNFRFGAALGGKPDAISDFRSADDTILLSKSVFRKLDPGMLSDEAFRDIGESANQDTRITYRANGDLAYDKDGKGGADAIVFAKLTTTPAIDAGDFMIA